MTARKPRAKPTAKSPVDAVGKLATRPKARYDAAGSGRRMQGWITPSSGPNRAIVGLQNIRNRARDVERNDWAGESSTQHWTTNLIGVGITPRLTRITDKPRKAFLTDLWSDWVKRADADGVFDFFGQQNLAVRSWLSAGEVFVRKRSRSLDFGMAVPMQIQLIEAEFVPLWDTDAHPFLSKGNRVRSGIELDRAGQRIAYWMYREHPGDSYGSTIDITRLIRVPADEVKHVYCPTRPGQLRGVSQLAPVLTRLRGIGDFDDAVLERQKIANLFTLFLTRVLPISGDADTDPLTNLPLETGMIGGEDTGPMVSLQPGTSQELLPGEDVKFSEPPDAGTVFSEYIRTQHMGTSAGAGLPYEIFSGDIRNVSDRTLRVLILEFRRFAEQRQWQVVIPMFCQPVREWWVDAAVIAGHVSTAEADDVKRVEWQPHGWPYIHPVQDPEGKALEVKNGFRSQSSVISERGDDPESVAEERAADMEREKDLGLWVDPNPAKPASAAAP